MKEINAFQCSDGSIHADDKKAKDHEENILGEELDGLINLFELEITRNQQFKALLLVIGKKKQLSQSIASIMQILTHSDE